MYPLTNMCYYYDYFCNNCIWYRDDCICMVLG